MKDMYICYYDLNNLKNNSNNLILMEVGRQKLLHFYIDNNWEEKLMSYKQTGSSKILERLEERYTWL